MNLADRARQFLTLGIREVAGPKSHPQILDWLKRTENAYPTDIPLDDGKYSWCGVFVGCMVMDDGNLPKPPRYFQGAKNWMKWGGPATVRLRGQVVVLTRPGGHHVAIADEWTKAGVYVIGGNQGDAVSRQFYPKARIVDVRTS